MVEYVYALHDFTPEYGDEISFKAGERIEVIKRDEPYGDGWWQGRNLAGNVGIFPQVYSSASPPTSSNASTASISEERVSSTIETVYALHDFTPEYADEISFRAGERIEILEKDELYKDGWWQGRNLSGKVGLFPQCYTCTLASLPRLQEEDLPSSPEHSEGTSSSSNDLATMATTLTEAKPVKQSSVHGGRGSLRSVSAGTRDARGARRRRRRLKTEG